LTPPSVLIVDDEAELTSALEERLCLRGFRAVGVTNGPAALAQLDAMPWDVVLVDVKMPGLSGLDLVRAIRDRHPAQPVILLTGHASEEDAAAGQAMGVNEYLLKPVGIEQLVEVLRATADKKEGAT